MTDNKSPNFHDYLEEALLSCCDAMDKAVAEDNQHLAISILDDTLRHIAASGILPRSCEGLIEFIADKYADKFIEFSDDS